MYRYNHHVWDLDLPAREKLVLLYLLDRANESGACWPSIASIARATGIPKRSVIRLLGSLKARGLLSWEHLDGEGWRRNSYQIHLEALTQRGMEPVEGGGATTTPPSATTTPPSATVAPGGDKNEGGWCHGDTRVVTQWHTNQSNNHPYNQTLESLEYRSGESHNLTPVKEPGGEDTDRETQTILLPAPSKGGSLQKATPAAREGVHEAPDPLAPLGTAAPLVRRLMAQAPGKAHVILERAKAMAELYGAEALEALWRHAMATADHSPLGAWLRYADPTVPLPPEVRAAVGRKEANPAVSWQRSRRYSAYLISRYGADARPEEAIRAGEMRLNEEEIKRYTPWLLEWARERVHMPGVVSEVFELHGRMRVYRTPEDLAENLLVPDAIATPREIVAAFGGEEPFLPPFPAWRELERQAKELWAQGRNTSRSKEAVWATA